jgi:hypothetical protein
LSYFVCHVVFTIHSFSFYFVIIATPLLYILYGVLTSLCALTVLAIVLRAIILTDFTSPASDHTDSFECGYNASDFTSMDMLDLRIVVSLYLIFDTELWFLMTTITSTHTSIFVLSLLLVFYFLYTALELYIMV